LSEGVPTDEIVSLCMECNENGVTRFMYTKIPMFKEIILSSFTCDHCGNKNTEAQFGGKLEEHGVVFTQTIADASYLNRSCVKSEFATIKIPEL
jgi:zinc finger protein